MACSEAYAFSQAIAPSSQPLPRRRVYVQATGNSIDISGQAGIFSITREMIKCFFDLSAAAAAKVFGVCLTVLKNMRRWMRLNRWPFDLVNRGTFEMTRGQIVELRLKMIAKLEAGGSELSKYQGVLPMLKEAVKLGLGYKAISARGLVVSSVEKRVKALPIRGSQVGSSKPKPKPKPVESASAMPARVVTEVFRMPVVKRRVNWVSQGAVCLSDEKDAKTSDAKAEDAKAEEVKTPDAKAEEKQEEPPRAPICPYAYVKDCITPGWVEPAYPPVSDITDGISAFWPVMDDPRRIWMQELLCRSLVPSRSAHGLGSEGVGQSEPLSAAEVHYVGGFLAV